MCWGCNSNKAEHFKGAVGFECSHIQPRVIKGRGKRLLQYAYNSKSKHVDEGTLQCWCVKRKSSGSALCFKNSFLGINELPCQALLFYCCFYTKCPLRLAAEFLRLREGGALPVANSA